MNPSRPKNLNLLTIRFPLPAIISILHRASGVFLFLLIPLLLWALQFSLTASGFDTLQQWLSLFSVKLIFWLLFIPFCFHLLAGVRHLLSDINIGVSLKGGRRSAQITIIIFFVVMILAGFYLW